MKFISEKYPEAIIGPVVDSDPPRYVQFSGGVLETTDEAEVKTLEACVGEVDGVSKAGRGK